MSEKKIPKRYEENYGAVVILDSLGTKGIWKTDEPNMVLEDWDTLIDTFDMEFKRIEKRIGVKLSLNAFSDTIIITCAGKDIYRCLTAAGGITRIMITGGLLIDIFLRGCISIGEFYKSKRMILGPAIDEAAQYYERGNWIGAFTTPSAYSTLLRFSTVKDLQPPIRDYFEVYDVPTKNKTERNWAVTFDDTWGSEEWLKNAKGKSMIEFVHAILENSESVDDGEKWKNTLNYMYHLKGLTNK